MGRKRDADCKRHVTGKEDAVFLDDWLDEPEDDYIDFENNPAYSGTRGINRELTHREKKAMEKAAKEAEKLRKIREEADRKAALKAAREAEKEAKREAARKKAEKRKAVSKKKSHSSASAKKSGAGKSGTSKHTGSAKQKRAKEKEISAQQSIPYREMAKDGICRYRINIIRNLSAFMTSITSWHRMRIRTLFLRTGAISSIILTAQYIFSCPLSTITATWRNMNPLSRSSRRTTLLTM